MREVALFFKILADETRLRILWLLLNHEELCVCDIMEALGITQSKASRHLATLRHAGLVADRKAGAWSYYSLCEMHSDLARAQLAMLRTHLTAHPEAVRDLRNLGHWLERKERDETCSTGRPGRATLVDHPAEQAAAGSVTDVEEGVLPRKDARRRTERQVSHRKN